MWKKSRVLRLLGGGRLKQASGALGRMLDGVTATGAFQEWYPPAGEPMGSGMFRGEAGVLFTAIEMMRDAVE